MTTWELHRSFCFVFCFSAFHHLSFWPEIWSDDLVSIVISDLGPQTNNFDLKLKKRKTKNFLCSFFFGKTKRKNMKNKNRICFSWLLCLCLWCIPFYYYGNKTWLYLYLLGLFLVFSKYHHHHHSYHINTWYLL